MINSTIKSNTEKREAPIIIVRRDTLSNIIPSIRNANMDNKGTIRIASTKITVKTLGLIENVRKDRHHWFELFDMEKNT